MREPTKPGTAHIISEDEARSGVTGHNVRYVLAAGLILVVASFVTLLPFV
jgi:hypothetical protein